ncbi:MAG: hypothetical protein IPM22_15745 [Betaproteobacteria bacterium]|nr:hypothetical protein [Betaproteobacteria bacterium]
MKHLDHRQPPRGARIAASFRVSFADIVVGIEDGTGSNFGLVPGGAASTYGRRVVRVAGFTGAAADGCAPVGRMFG